MSRARSALGTLLSLCSLLHAVPSYADKTAAPTPAPAGDAPPQLAPKLDLEGPEAEAKDRARVLFQQGVTAYRAGRYYDAVDTFLETQRIYPDTQLCFNVARAYENLGNASAALRYYRDYLRQADRPSDGEEVRERVRRLEEQLAQKGVQLLTVLSQPEGATVLLDGRPVGITPWNGETYAGRHRLALTLDRHTGTEQVIELDAHSAKDVSVVLVPLPAPSVTTQVIVREPSTKPAGVQLPTLVTLGSGLLLLGGAVIAEAASSASGMSRTTAFLAGSGLGVSSVGGVMLYFDLSPAGGSKRTPLREKDSVATRPNQGH